MWISFFIGTLYLWLVFFVFEENLIKKFLDFNIALALMYQLSMEEDAKAMIAFTDCISIVSI